LVINHEGAHAQIHVCWREKLLWRTDGAGAAPISITKCERPVGVVPAVEKLERLRAINTKAFKTLKSKVKI